MKRVISILFIFIGLNNLAQEKYPTILELNLAQENRDSIASDYNLHQYLMLNNATAINLNEYGNEECQFKILSSNSNKILLEFEQPSKLAHKGMCASGTEKGFLYFQLSNDLHLEKSERYLTESCLLMIEILSQENVNYTTLYYTCENLQTSETYTIIADLKNTTIKKEEN